MDCNFWSWLNSNAGAMGVIAAFALAAVTFIYVVLMEKNVKATRNMVEEMKSERTKRELKATVYCLVKYRMGNYQTLDEQVRYFAEITHQAPTDITFALYELDLDGRVGLLHYPSGNALWHVRGNN